jgi:DNA polymerase-3 subunit epsilon
LKDQVFCVVDIETTAGNTKDGQIIEIGAVKMHRGKIIDTFDMLVKCNEISSHITEITGITVEMTKDALPLCIVIEKFRQFLADDIFVAHDINFDYNFISASMQKCQMLPMLNRKLCSIQLAERSIVSYRYKLSYLNDTLDLYRDATHHRALSDAMTTTYLLKHIFNYLPRTMDGVEELLKFSKQARRLKRPKFDPVQVEKNRTKAEI